MLKNNIEVDVKVKCIENGMTQVQLADAAQISVKTLQKYERGERNIQNAHSNTVLKLAQVLDVSPYLLLG